MLTIATAALYAIVLAVLARIATIDFKQQKIYNRDVLILAGLGLAILVLKALWRQEQLQSDIWQPVYMSLLIAAVLFVLLLPFWIFRKVGAGDVKLMAVTPLIASAENMLLFTVLLLGFTILTALIMRYPILLPAAAFREYVKHFERKRVVPFGVPISAALLIVVIARALGNLS